MVDRGLVFADLKGSVTSEISHISPLLAELQAIPSAASDKKTWGDAYYAVFDSAYEALKHALAVRDALRDHDWCAAGFLRPPRLRIAVTSGPFEFRPDEIEGIPHAFGSPPFWEAARLEPVVIPGEVWITDGAVHQASLTTPTEFYFEDLGEIDLAKGFGKQHIFRAHRADEASSVREGRTGPLADDHYYRRITAFRRFALLWFFLDQLPVGSWGRSVAPWMNEVWHDIPSIPPNPLIDEEGGFETTVLNLELLTRIHPRPERTSTWQHAQSYLRQRHTPQGFGNLSLSRLGTEVDPHHRQTALVGWLCGSRLPKAASDARLTDLFHLAATSLFLSSDPSNLLEQFITDRNPVLLYLAAWHVHHQVNTPQWSDSFTNSEQSRINDAWNFCEHKLHLKALDDYYPTNSAGPENLIEENRPLYPLTVPYGGFVRMEAYSLLSAALLVDPEMPQEVQQRIAEGVAFIAENYLSSFGMAEQRYSRDPLRAVKLDAKRGLPCSRGVSPFFTGPDVHPDLGTTAMLLRTLRLPQLRDRVSSILRGGSFIINHVRRLLEEDLLQQFDHYLISPRLFSLTHPGMLAGVLAGDHPDVRAAILSSLGDVIAHPPTSVVLRGDTLDHVLSERHLQDLVEQVVATDSAADPITLQISTHSLTRLLVDRVRPGRYLSTRSLSTDGVRKVAEQTISVYSDDAFVKKYSATWGQAVDHSMCSLFIAQIQKGSRILDVGCGPGHYSEVLACAGHDVDLVDASRAALVLSEERLSKLGKRFTVYQCNVLDRVSRACVPASRQYDAIWCSGLFAHIPRENWADVLAWFGADLLKAGGCLFVNVMLNNERVFARDRRFFTHVRSTNEFESVLAKSGFRSLFMVQKTIERNTYGEPFLKTHWANFYATYGASEHEPDLESLASVMTSFAYERSYQLFLARHLADTPQRVARINRILDRLSELVVPIPPTILDVGCGGGDALKEIAKRGWSGYGIDISEQMIRQAEQTVAGQPGHVKLQVADMSALSAEWTGLFDAVICITALQHVPRFKGRLERVLSEMSRVLRPGGVVRIDVRIGAEGGFDPDLRYIEAFKSVDEIRPLYEAAGLRLLDTPSHYSLPAGQNTFKRQIELKFAEIWLRKE